jgi:DNA-binding beta-propeller fold protein YncE
LKTIFRLLPMLVISPLLFAQSYHVTGSIPLGGRGAWDYLSADVQARRLYVSHGNEVYVIDLDSRRVVGKMSGFGFVHGIVVVDDLKKGFISDGDKNEIAIFDPTTLRIEDKVKTLPDPNSMVYDRASGRLFAGHKSSHAMTAIQARTDHIEGIVQLGAEPEFPVSDGTGNIYVNTEDTSEILKIDAKTLEVRAHWPIAPCKSPSGLAFDIQKRELFSTCDNNLMAIVDADSGKVIATAKIGGGPDAAAYDPVKLLVFSSNGDDGTFTVIGHEDKNLYPVLQTVKTEKGARTMALDTKTHAIYLSSAKLGPPQVATPRHPHTHPTALPGTFKVLIIEP